MTRLNPRLEAHPSVRAVRARPAAGDGDPLFATPGVLDHAALRDLYLRSGADDVGFVDIDRPALADQIADITAAFPVRVPWSHS